MGVEIGVRVEFGMGVEIEARVKFGMGVEIEAGLEIGVTRPQAPIGRKRTNTLPTYNVLISIKQYNFKNRNLIMKKINIMYEYNIKVQLLEKI